ncbi:MAG: hypothetical protein Q7S16_04985 [bacterium]|nr:hypothetical protein [bacterium]
MVEILALVGRILSGLGGIAIMVIGIGNFVCALQEYRQRIQWRTLGPHYNRNTFIASIVFSLMVVAMSIPLFSSIWPQV